MSAPKNSVTLSDGARKRLRLSAQEQAHLRDRINGQEQLDKIQELLEADWSIGERNRVSEMGKKLDGHLRLLNKLLPDAKTNLQELVDAVDASDSGVVIVSHLEGPTLEIRKADDTNRPLEIPSTTHTVSTASVTPIHTAKPNPKPELR